MAISPDDESELGLWRMLRVVSTLGMWMVLGTLTFFLLGLAVHRWVVPIGQVGLMVSIFLGAGVSLYACYRRVAGILDRLCPPPDKDRTK